MIKISKSTKEETEEFSKTEWAKADKVHYGKNVNWKETKLRLKATENGKIVGMLTGEYEAEVVYIGSVITAEDMRGKGIGKMLIQKAIELGKDLGTHKIWLMTGANWPERAFYEKIGFKSEGILKNHHAHQDFVVYSKFIN